MANVETKITEGLDTEGRVILSCEVWETEGSENYAEVVYSSYMDEYTVVFGIATVQMFDTAVAGIKGYGA